MIFASRKQAGRLLARELERYRSQDVVVLALPRGGVPVAFEIAEFLGAPLDLLLVRKVGLPGQSELAMGAVIDGGEPTVVRNEDVIRMYGVSENAFRAVCETELAEIERRRNIYLAGKPPENIADRIAIIVDDGIATGATVRAAIRGLRKRNPAAIVLAVPVASADTLRELEREVDDVVCLSRPDYLQAIGFHYQDFHQLSDEDVKIFLDQVGRNRGMGEASITRAGRIQDDGQQVVNDRSDRS